MSFDTEVNILHNESTNGVCTTWRPYKHQKIVRFHDDFGQKQHTGFSLFTKSGLLQLFSLVLIFVGSIDPLKHYVSMQHRLFKCYWNSVIVVSVTILFYSNWSSNTEMFGESILQYCFNNR